MTLLQHTLRPLTAESAAVILVNFKGTEITVACLAALARLAVQPRFIMVVDNNSQDGSVAHIMRQWGALAGPVLMREGSMQTASDLTHTRHLILALSKNEGFAAGNNAALRLLLAHTDCTSFWLLNNDAEPEPGALDQLCARLNERPDAGMCGSTLLYAHAPELVQAAGGSTLSLWTGFSKFLCGGMSHFKVQGYFAEDVQRIEHQMGYVVGASCLVRREVFEQVGLLPEEYFLYYEDAAFCLNATRAGFALAWAKDSAVMHKEGGSTRASAGKNGGASVRPAYVDYLTVRNRVALVRHYNPWALPVLLATLAGVYANRVRRGQADRLGLILRAAWHGFIGKMGYPPDCCKESSQPSRQ